MDFKILMKKILQNKSLRLLDSICELQKDIQKVEQKEYYCEAQNLWAKVGVDPGFYISVTSDSGEEGGDIILNLRSAHWAGLHTRFNGYLHRRRERDSFLIFQF